MVWCWFTEILAAEGREVLNWRWNSERPLFFSHVTLNKTLGVHRSREIGSRITMRMDLWERFLHTGLVGYTEEEWDSQDGRDTRGGG